MTSAVTLGTHLEALVRAWYRREPEWGPDVSDWDSLWALVRRHGLDGMAGALAAQGARVPEPLREKACEAYCSNSLRYRRAETTCRKVCRAASEAGIPLSVVKGPALMPAYADDGIRGFGDIDVLVPDAVAGFKLADACGLTVRHGYVTPPPVFWKRARSIGRVEAAGPHTLVEFTHGRDEANQPLHDLCRHWQDSYLLDPASRDPFPVPADHAHLAFLLQHLALHWCNRLVWLVDFAVVMRGRNFDADWLEEAAGRLEMRKLLRAVTRYCKDKIDDSIPELGQGKKGWKDGLFLAMLSPDTYTRSALFKYGGGSFAEWIKDPVLGALQHMFATDLSCPSFSRLNAASRWTSAWLQFVFFPGGTVLTRLALPVTPFLYLVMLLVICSVFRRTPRGFARLVSQSGSGARVGAGFDLAKKESDA